jgi:hypothetical protein
MTNSLKPTEAKRPLEAWLSRAPKFTLPEVLRIRDTIVHYLGANGFVCVGRDRDGGRVQPNSLAFEKWREDGTFDFITIIFDNRYRSRIQAIVGRKRSAPPFEWLRGARLVTRQEERERSHWWTGNWWQFDRSQAMRAAGERFFTALPQAIDYLNSGNIGPNVKSAGFL